MPSTLIELDEATLRALDRIAPAARRSQFVRDAIRAAIRKQEYAAIREAYRKKPDPAAEADAWSNCEKYEA